MGQSGHKALLALDDMDTKRESLYLIERLSPSARVSWLRWCTAQCYFPKSTTNPCVPPGHSGIAMEVWMDMWTLISTFNLDSDIAFNELVRRVRGRPV